MDWKEISKDEAKEKYEQYVLNHTIDTDSNFFELKKDLDALFQNSLEALNITEDEISKGRNSYKLDLAFGIKLYSTLESKYGMDVRTASNDGVWRYLSVCVVPNLIEKRYGIEHEDRFWKKSKRLWLRVIWWYIYLSWQGNEHDTYSVLMNNSTDEILQLVDRCGRNGYRLSFCRELMKLNDQYKLYDRRKDELFRKIMVLNTARVQVIEPELSKNGVNGYIQDLYNYFEYNE